MILQGNIYSFFSPFTKALYELRKWTSDQIINPDSPYQDMAVYSESFSDFYGNLKILKHLEILMDSKVFWRILKCSGGFLRIFWNQEDYDGRILRDSEGFWGINNFNPRGKKYNADVLINDVFIYCPFVPVTCLPHLNTSFKPCSNSFISSTPYSVILVIFWPR